MAVTGFGHIAFRVKDMERSVKFYTEVLGFKKMHEIPTPNGNIVFLEISNKQSLEFFVGGKDEQKPTDTSIGYMHLCLITENTKELVESIKAKGIELYQEPSYGDTFNCFRVLDPDGNELEMLERVADMPF